MPVLEDDAMMTTLKKTYAGIKARQKGMGQVSDKEAKMLQGQGKSKGAGAMSDLDAKLAKEAASKKPALDNGMMSARREQKDIEGDLNLVKGTGFSNRGNAYAKYADKDGKAVKGAGMREAANYAPDGSREAADMRKTADRQNRVSKGK